jgi:peroxiredoxin
MSPKLVSRPLSDGTRAPDFTLPDEDGDGCVRHHSSGLLVSDPHVQESLRVVLSLK